MCRIYIYFQSAQDFTTQKMCRMTMQIIAHRAGRVCTWMHNICKYLHTGGLFPCTELHTQIKGFCTLQKFLGIFLDILQKFLGIFQASYINFGYFSRYFRYIEYLLSIGKYLIKKFGGIFFDDLLVEDGFNITFIKY